MERSDFDKFYAANIGLIRAAAWKGCARLRAIGAAVELDDMVQELTASFLRAYDLFDESKGVRFSTYFTRSAYNRINQIAEKYEAERIDLGMRSIEEMDSWGEDGTSIEETIDSGWLSPEQAYVRSRAWSDFVRSLSPLAAMLMQWLAEPPEFVTNELLARQAHCEFARNIGIQRRQAPEVDLALIGELMLKLGVAGVREIRDARAELREKTEGILEWMD